MRKVILFTLVVILVSSCGHANRRDTEKVPQKNDSTSTVLLVVKPTVNVYIENSGSMDGYVTGRTEFKGAIRDLLVLLKYHYDEDSINVFFINQQINNHKSNTKIDIASFATNIEMKWRDGQAKKLWQSTNLNQIFNMILGETDNKTISILFSDCIYSIHGSTDAIGLLNDEKSLTKDAFLSKWRNDNVPLATTIVKMNSKFDGMYYPFTGDNNRFHFSGNRPYYFCVIANQEILTDFNKNIKLEAGKIEGFENKYVLSSEDAKSSYYSVLQSTYNKGRFKPDRKVSKKDYIRGIEGVNLQTSGGGCSRGKEEPLSFAVAVDFSNIQAEDDYLKNPANYTVITNNFTIDSIISVDKSKIKPNDWNRIAASNPTHIIILTAKTKAVSDVSFVLKKQMPQWVTNSNTEDDTDCSKLEGGKTFGLYYWVTGIAEAYETIYPNNKNFFECSISINK